MGQLERQTQIWKSQLERQRARPACLELASCAREREFESRRRTAAVVAVCYPPFGRGRSLLDADAFKGDVAYQAALRALELDVAAKGRIDSAAVSYTHLTLPTILLV